MAFDAGMVRAITTELNTKLAGARVEKIHQPEKDELLFLLHAGRENLRLTISASVNNPRIHLSSTAKENPSAPPLFCTLIRKHLSGAKLLSLEQLGFERVIRLSFQARDEMGFHYIVRLYAEIMGKYSNLILTDENDKVLGAVKPVDFTTSQKRQVLPGMQYEMPPAQDKIDPTTEVRENFLALRADDTKAADKFLTAHYLGLSTLSAREIVHRAADESDEALREAFSAFMSDISAGRVTPTLVLDEGGMILEEPIGGVKGTYAMVGVLEKGYGDLKFIARGKGGHASAPGKNTPLVRLGKFMTDVEKHDPFTSRFCPTVSEMFRRLTPNMNFGMKLVFANLWLFEPLLKKVRPLISPAGAAMLHTTVAFTMAKGAEGLNVLPQEAFVTANLRFIPHQPTDESIKVIRDVAAKYQLETEEIYKDYPCPVVDFRGEAFRKVEEAINEIYPGVGVSPYAMTGGTDAKFYTEICDNCIRFAPLYIDKQQYGSIHGLNENISIGALPGGVDFYKAIIRKNNAV